MVVRVNAKILAAPYETTTVKLLFDFTWKQNFPI